MKDDNYDIAVNPRHPDPDGHLADIAANPVDPGRRPRPPIVPPREGDQADFLDLHLIYRNGKWVGNESF